MHCCSAPSCRLALLGLMLAWGMQILDLALPQEMVSGVEAFKVRPLLWPSPHGLL